MVPALLNWDMLTINMIKRESEQISKALHPIANGRAVLTLSPVFVINAKTPIYPDFTNGPFAYKYSYLMPPELAAEQNMIRRSDIEQFIQEKNPAAILTGHEKEVDEASIVDAARKFNYRNYPLPSGNILWLPP